MLTTATVQTFLFIHIGVILVAAAYYTLSAALAPALTERARRRFARRPWLPALIGLAASVPWTLASIILLNTESAGLKFVGAVLGCLWILCGLLGGAAIAQHVGGNRGGEGAVGATTAASWVQTVRGGLFISLTWVLPLVGWLVMLPLTLAAGLGCMMIGVFPDRRDAATSTISAIVP